MLWNVEMEMLSPAMENQKTQAYPRVPKNKQFYLTEQSALQVVSIWWGLVESFATFIWFSPEKEIDIILTFSALK